MRFFSELLSQSSEKDKKLFYLLSIIVFFIGALLRFYQLDKLPGPVFDEVFFPEYGYNYLTGREFFHVHPPLYNYISSIGIWIYFHLPWVDLPPIGTIEFKDLEAISYRWINAVFGTLLVLITLITTLRLTKSKSAALIASLFVAIDGSIVVDSRFGMNNIFLIVFGLLAIWATLKAHQLDKNKEKWFFIASIFLGCTVAIKWNGLGYVLALLAMFLGAYFVKVFDKYRPVKAEDKESSSTHSILHYAWWKYPLYLFVLPAVVYSLLWIPDRLFNTEYTFVQMHQQILGYHSTMVTPDEHPYCSKWYSWPIMERPIGYSFSSRVGVDTLGNETTFYTDVHLFGNPALYWLSTIAIVVMCFGWLKCLFQWFKFGVINRTWLIYTAILLGYFANLTPWALVSRCVFFYLYQSASVFAFFALAYYLSLGLKSSKRLFQYLAIAILLLVAAACIYWLPFALGIELPKEGFYQRMWFNSWI